MWYVFIYVLIRFCMIVEQLINTKIINQLRAAIALGH